MKLKTIFCLLSLLLVAGCSAIDDDLSDCPPVPPAEKDFELRCELRLVTNISTELNTQLNTITETGVANALRSHLQDIFTDHAHDVNLSFYDTEGAQQLLRSDQHVMDASERSYTIYLPVREYIHLAVANIKNNKVVELQDVEQCPTSHLVTKPVGEDRVIDSHSTGLFTARQPMKVDEGVDQTFHVSLYMANCAEALVIDPRGHHFKDIKVYATGFASEFNISDSTYVFDETAPQIRASQLDTNGGSLCFCAVHFPSKDKEDGTMKTVIETDEPFDSEASDQVFWKLLVYVTEDDDTVTKTELDLHETLKAGQFKIVKGWINEKGAIQTGQQEVTATVTLDWKEGGQFNPQF